jgi:hypothetical protein
MCTGAIIFIVAAFGIAVATAGAVSVPRNERADGMVFRYYAASGNRFQPLLSFGKLNSSSRHIVLGRRGGSQPPCVREACAAATRCTGSTTSRSAAARPGWTSGFTQAVAAQALARTAVLVGDLGDASAAEAAFRGLRKTLLMPMAGGSWIREYSFTHQAILNAQLESILAVESYARIAGTATAARVAADLERAALRLLPRFDVGCWGRYQLGGAAADLHYQTYHVDLLRRLAARHAEPIWRTTYLRWSRCLP